MCVLLFMPKNFSRLLELCTLENIVTHALRQRFSHIMHLLKASQSPVYRESWRHAKFQLPLGYVTHDMGAKNTNHNQTLSCTNLFTWIALNLFFLPSYRVYRILEFLCMCVWKALCTNLPPVNIACVSIYSHIFTKIHFYYIFLYFVCWDDLTRFSPSLHSISKCKIKKKLSHFLLILRQHIWYTEICFNEFTNSDMNLRCHMLDSVDSVDVIKIIWNAVARRTNQRNFKNYSNCERYSV